MDVENKETNNEKKLGGVTGKGFMPGVSGNPGGRPKGTLKEYMSLKFREMSPEEKEEWLRENKISGDLQWRMGEGNPESKTDITTKGEKIEMTPQVKAIAEKYEEELKKTLNEPRQRINP